MIKTEELIEAIKRVVEAIKVFAQKLFDAILKYYRDFIGLKYNNKSKYIHGSNKHNFYKSNVKKSQVYNRKPVMLRCRSII